ncbi:MAG: YARHG domain-containing protein, partial [Deltaproteobacteria bacterium]|nr:YARHG domain-containing protein [Deltaproteobacteria bacterium]
QMSQLWIATLDGAGTKDLKEHELVTDTGFEASFLHGAFVDLRYTKTPFEENEAGAMDVAGEPVAFHEYFVIDTCKVVPLAEVPREKLRFFRNRVFARYGYQFKSEDLTAYFSQFAWYEPTTTDVNTQVTEEDKRLIAAIRALE